MRLVLRSSMFGAGALLLVGALSLVAGATSSAARLGGMLLSAAPNLTVTSYPLPHDPNIPWKFPNGITAGPDGNLWFTESYANQIGRITPAGAIMEYRVPTANSYLRSITRGPDGNLWFTGSADGQIGRITPAGAITEYPVPGGSGGPYGITRGPDGNLWFTEGSQQIGRITPAGQVTLYSLPASRGSMWSITAGPDGNLWFTEEVSQIGRITPAGQVTEYPGFSYPSSITSGPDGNLWVTEAGSAQIARVTPGGVFTHYPLPSGIFDPSTITSGPDGNLWFLASGPSRPNGPAGELGRITPQGEILVIELPESDSSITAGGMTVGSDGNLWFTNSFNDRIQRLSDLGNLPTATPIPSATLTPTPVPTCPAGHFVDVCAGAWFYPWVTDLVNLGAISGYDCGGPGEPCDPQQRPYFRPYADITRGQLTKAALVSFGIPLSATAQLFADVPPDNAFYPYINTAYLRNIVSGYDCGGPGEPCDPENRPYFRPYTGITRGQASKIVTLAQGWALLSSPVGSFADVLPGTAFYSYVETIRAAGTISGHDCGGPGEPCDAQRRPYFRPGSNITRMQAAKILDLARTQAPPTPTPPAGTATPTATATPTELAGTPTVTPTLIPALR